MFSCFYCIKRNQINKEENNTQVRQFGTPMTHYTISYYDPDIYMSNPNDEELDIKPLH